MCNFHPAKINWATSLPNSHLDSGFYPLFSDVQKAVVKFGTKMNSVQREKIKSCVKARLLVMHLLFPLFGLSICTFSGSKLPHHLLPSNGDSLCLKPAGGHVGTSKVQVKTGCGFRRTLYFY